MIGNKQPTAEDPAQPIGNTMLKYVLIDATNMINPYKETPND